MRQQEYPDTIKHIIRRPASQRARADTPGVWRVKTTARRSIMNMVPKLSLIGSVIVLIIAIVLSLIDTNFVAGPNGWLDLALLLAVFSVAFKYVHLDKQ